MQELRKKRGLTQAQLAEQLELQQPWMAKVERGRLGLSLAQLRAICQVLHCDSDLLLGL